MIYGEELSLEESAELTARSYGRYPVKEAIVSYLRLAIVSGELKPGDTLHESSLSRQFGASRSPIREALVQLEQEGLVETFPKKGSVVTRIDRSQLRQALFIRTVLECSNIEMLAENITSDQLDRMHQNLQRQKANLLSDNYFESYAAMDEFHYLLCDFNHLPRIWELIRKDKIPLDRLHSLNKPHNPRMVILYSQHIGIVRALEARDSQLCSDLIKAHADIDFQAMSLVDEVHEKPLRKKSITTNSSSTKKAKQKGTK
jgi:DNA-binding GntR family transcriptional regulator